MATNSGLTRRDFLRYAALGLAGVALLSACAPTAPATKPAESKPAEPAKPAEVKPAAAAPTSAPPAAAKPAEAAKPAATPASQAEPKLGSQLIGKLEGPTVITDPAQFPKSFKEAPALAELVKAGKLPPVEQRVSAEPLVIKPVHEIGKYGGTWRRGFTGPADYWNGFRSASGPDHVLFWEYTGEQAVPNIARGWELSPDGRTTTVFLRKGMKWSDGQPFTADDFLFWYEDIYQNRELFPSPTSVMAINGRQGKVEKVDEVTVRFSFPDPYHFFPDVLAGSTPISSHAQMADGTSYGSYAPAHYLKPFLPKYTPQDQLDQKIKEAGVDNWVNLFKLKNSWALNPELPVISAWKTATPINTPVWTLERNPYSIWVDTDGNQLPYIDKIQLTLAENLEVLNLRAIAGEYDFQARHIDIGKLPVFLENQQKGNYKVYLDVGDYGGDMVIKFNLSIEDPELSKWFSNADFRRALSMGIDREQINETFWLGTGTPGSVVPAEHNKYNPGPEYRALWSTLDLTKANEMLDKIGLEKKDAEGYRMRSDGSGRLRLEVMTQGGQFVQFTRISEMIREHWKKIGIDLIVQETERSLAAKRVAANDFQLYAWNNDGSEHMFTFPGHVFTFDATSSSGPLFGQWFQTNGQQGKEPPPRLKELMEKWRKAFGVPEAERIQLGKDVWKIAAEEVYIIGVIGLGAASQGVRITKNNVGNAPSRMYNSPDGKTPGISRPVTFYFKS
jgi:peptide/nickel transport system substrate-binding protein